MEETWTNVAETIYKAKSMQTFALICKVNFVTFIDTVLSIKW